MKAGGTGVGDVSLHTTSEGRNIYCMPIEVFPNFIGNVYVISDGESRLLVDTGSPMPNSNQNLVAAMAQIGEKFGEPIELKDIDKILITHGHTDHFGGLPFVREHTDAPVGVHILDRRILSHYEERVVVAAKGLAVFLAASGISETAQAATMQMYMMTKSIYRSGPVSFELAEGQTLEENIEVFHVPGHCPGQVCLGVDDVMLVADHVLSRITPHQSPESLTLNMGLGHYLESLAKVEKFSNVRLALGGHEDPIDDLPGRVKEIKDSHDDRLNKVMEICKQPSSTLAVSKGLFGKVGGYTVLLALEEAAAHVEYLYQRGELVAANVETLRDPLEPVVEYVVA
jgi:glyoxylase-like metal-dependent hydrolase (beta-lactamase superfamily II)